MIGGATNNSFDPLDTNTTHATYKTCNVLCHIMSDTSFFFSHTHTSPSVKEVRKSGVEGEYLSGGGLFLQWLPNPKKPEESCWAHRDTNRLQM